MSARLSLLSDDELARLRRRIEGFARTADPEHRLAAAQQLEAIDVERERRLSMPPGG